MAAQVSYQSVMGPVDGYESMHVTVLERGNQLLGIEPTLHERDELRVAGRHFFIECDRPPETLAAPVGRFGKCLKVRLHETITVDFVAPTATTYRTDPLKVSAID